MDRNTYDAGDWFNKTDFTKASNNWNVGLPLAQDNQSAWETIGGFVYGSDRAASAEQIAFAGNVFKELLRIRSGSELFRLTTAADIKARVGFHNIGRTQQPGVIAMSIDDGTGFADLDSNVDAIMVVINSNYEESSIRVNTATGFTLHDIQAASVDTVVRGASFAEGTDDDEGNGLFTVPAQTIAVFVKDQGAEQGTGLSAYATSGAPDIVPYGSTTVYLRGSMNGWGTGTPFNYAGDGIYTATYDLTGGQQEQFKVAEADWANPNLGAPDGESDVVTEGSAFALVPSNNNLRFTPDADASYEFVFDAADLDNPTLLVRKDNPYFGTAVYVRGGMNGWGTGNEMSYDGNKTFSAVFNHDGNDIEFKVASEDWSTVDHGASEDSDAARNFTVGGTLQANVAGGPNFRLLGAAAEELLVTLDVSDPAMPMVGLFKFRFFGETPVFLRGGMNGWGTVDEVVFDATTGTYAAQIDISAGVTEFKVASDDWATVNMGAAEGENEISLDSPVQLIQDSQTNFRFDFPANGTYTFTVGPPLTGVPSLTVTQNP